MSSTTRLSMPIRAGAMLVPRQVWLATLGAAAVTRPNQALTKVPYHSTSGVAPRAGCIRMEWDTLRYHFVLAAFLRRQAIPLGCKTL